jgi:AP-1 complex subunit gamma-1
VVFHFPDPRFSFVSKVDLLGDDISAPSDPVVAVPGGHKTNEDLLAEIFGSSTATATTTPTPASQPQKTTAADILGLFDSPAPSAPPQAPPTAAPSLFDLSPAVTVTAAAAAAPPPPKPAAPNLPSYTAYNKNDLLVSLTPQRSTTQRGVVDILARFQVKGNAPATGLNFQVAVPKVSRLSLI